MSTLKTNNIEHLDASTPSIQTTIGGGTILAGVSTVSGTLNVGSGTSISSPATNELALGTNNAERLRINSSGSVGIGSDNPQNKLDVAGDVKILDNSPRLFLYDANATGASSATGGFEVFDKDGNKNVFVGAFAPDAGNLIFGVTGSERLRIDSSGRVLINQTSVGAKSVSAPLQLISSSTGAFGLNISMRSNNDYGFISYTDHDADEDIAQIGVQRTAANTGDLIFYTNGGNASATEKARILSTGGITFNGDTATANALDDYEEGTWTVTMANGVTLHSGVDLATYVKVGSLVTVFGQLRVNNANSGANLHITNLPFACASQTENETLAVGNMRLYNAGITGAAVQVICVTSDGGNILYFNEVRDNTNDLPCQATQDGYYMFNVTYKTSS